MLENIVNFVQAFSSNWLIQAVLGNVIYALVLAIIAVVWRMMARKHKNDVLDILESIESFTESFSSDYSDDKTKSNFRKFFDKYTKPTFLTYRFKGNEEEKSITFKKLLKYVTDKKDRRRVLMVYAEAGMGKSRLLRYLAYKLLLNKSIKESKDEPINTLPLVGYGVYYTEFINYQSIDELINEIKEKKNTKGIKYLLLDGFDEYREYLRGDSSAVDILKRFFDKLDSKKIKEGVSRIIITLRVDMLENESNALNSLSVKTLKNGILEEQAVDIIKMDYFTVKQVIHRYNIVNRLYKSNKRSKITKKLLKHLEEDDKSILRVPFFIMYTNYLFDESPSNVAYKLTREAGLNIIVTKCIQKEYWIYEEANKNVKLENYTAEMMSVFSKTAFVMYKENRLSLPYEEYNKLPCKYQIEKERLLMIRDSRANQDYFRFQHKLFYEYFLVYFILDDVANINNEILLSVEERRKLLGFRQSINDEINFRKRLYAHILAKEGYEIIVKSIKSFSSNNITYSIEQTNVNKLLEAESITVTDNPIWNINRIILLLPLIQSLHYRNFQIHGHENLKDYVDDKFIEINKEVLPDTKGGKKFGKLAVLDTTVGKIGIGEFNNFDEIDEIRVLIENINDFNELMNIKIVKKIGLLVKVETTVLPILVQMVTDINLREEIFYFCNTIKLDQINEAINSIPTENNTKVLNNKLIFLEQLFFVETYHSNFMNEDTLLIRYEFVKLFKQNFGVSDEFICDLIQKRTDNYGKSHPYTMNVWTLYTHGQLQLGECYLIEKNYDKALECIQKSAKQDNIFAQGELGTLYYLGYAVNQDYDKAVELFQKAAKQNNSGWHNYFGEFYFHSFDSYQDDDNLTDIIERMKKLFSQSNAEAQYRLGLCYYYGHGVNQDYDQAIEWFQKAANKCNPFGQLLLGICYYYGHGIDQDYNKAVELFLEAYRCNLIWQHFIMFSYYFNSDLIQDANENLSELLTDWTRSNEDWQYWIGGCYYDGIVIGQDYEKAVEWFKKAAEQGDVDGQLLLGICFYYGHGVEQDYNKAIKWFQKTADQGDADGQEWMGSCYYEGHGVKQDYEKAVEWLQKSVDQGNVSAQECLDKIKKLKDKTTIEDEGILITTFV
jgi:TPR repeat protein